MRKYPFIPGLLGEIYFPIPPILCALLFFSVLIFLPSLQAHSAQVTLQWDAETDPNLAGYKVYYGASSRNYDSYVNGGNTTTCTISNLQDGHTYYFSATAVDTAGRESGYSNEVVYNSVASCTYALSSSTQSFGSSGGTASVMITAGTTCIWTAISNTSWIIITSNSSGSGSYAVNYSVAENSSPASRSGTMTIAGQTFTVNQAGSGTCTYSIAWGFHSLYNADGGWGVIYVTSPPGCSWRAVSDSSWIVINSGGNGSGREEVAFSVAPNTSNIWRYGMISVGENNFQIGQMRAW